MTVDKVELRRLAEAATFGPWESVKRSDYDGGHYLLIQTQAERNGWEVAEIRMDVPHDNASFIAAANPSTVLALLDECESGEQWRNLALQFDMHRMQAMALIRMVASGVASSSQCFEFAARPPIPGHEITDRMSKAEAERDAALAELEGLRAQVSTLTDWYSNALSVISEVSAAIPGVTYMDLPDGGDVSIPEQIRRMARDAERYQWLRTADWWDSPICVIRSPKTQAMPGSDCPSRGRLDEAVDAAMAHAKENGND